MLYNTRTDMASELLSRSRGQSCSVSKEKLFDLDVASICISQDEAEALGKPCGKYYTLSIPRRCISGSTEFYSCCSALCALMRRCIPRDSFSFLVACLGNPNITPDALGSLAGEEILVTRHLKDQADGLFADFSSVALCRPGVLGTSGVESALQISMLCREVCPDCLIVIDALAGSDSESLCARVQISDAGISPGSGVGNDRQEITKRTVGIPVVSVGVPTVIDAGLIGSGELSGMFVTPSGIDALVRNASHLIASGLNMAMNPAVSPDQILGLMRR